MNRSEAAVHFIVQRMYAKTNAEYKQADEALRQIYDEAAIEKEQSLISEEEKEEMRRDHLLSDLKDDYEINRS